MAFNFDSCPERAGTDSTKWHKYHGRDVIPCWIADMDFESAPAIVEAVKARAAHGVFGYPAQRDAVFASVVNHVRRRHGWEIITGLHSSSIQLDGTFELRRVSEIGTLSQ